MISKSLTLLWASRDRLSLVISLIRDNRIPRWQRAIPFLPIIYFLSPLNIISFSLPIVGQIDDIVLIMMTLDLFERVIDEKILKEHKNHHSENLS